MPLRTVTKLPIKDLKLLENNPRKITKEQFQKLCTSIEEDPDFLMGRPVLVNNTNDRFIVYAGNQRVKAAKKLGWKEIPCMVEVDVPQNVIERRIIKDNAHFGEFDWDLLANNYEIDVLLEAGLTAEQLVGGVQEIEEVEAKEEKPEVVKHCPHCNGIL